VMTDSVSVAGLGWGRLTSGWQGPAVAGLSTPR